MRKLRGGASGMQHSGTTLISDKFPQSYLSAPPMVRLGHRAFHDPSSSDQIFLSASCLEKLRSHQHTSVPLAQGILPVGCIQRREQVGYSVADIIAKAVLGVLIWAIAAGQFAAEEKSGLLN